MAPKRDAFIDPHHAHAEVYICESVTIVKTRWQVEFTIHRRGHEDVVLIASADAALTDHDRIWFGTKKEYEETEA